MNIYLRKFYDFNLDGLKGGADDNPPGGDGGSGTGGKDGAGDQGTGGEDGAGGTGGEDGKGDQGKGAEGAGGDGSGEDGKGGTDGTGGEDGKGDQGKAGDDAAAAAKKAEEDAKKKWLESLGVKSEEELREKLNPKPEETPEQKLERERKYNADLDNFAVTNKFIDREEIIKLENLKKMQPLDIVFDNFAASEKEKNKEITDEQIRENFEALYHQKSENATLKEKGEALLQKEAKVIIDSLENKMKDAKEQFDDTLARRAKVPEYRRFVSDQITKHLPEQLQVATHEDGTPINYQIDAETRKDVEKFLVSEDLFDEFFKNGASAQTEKSIKEKIEAFILIKNKDKIFSTISSAAKAKGLQEGSTAGATNAFGGKNEKPLPVEDKITAEDDQRLGSILGGRR